MDRRHFMKSSIMAALANPIQAMAKSKTMKIKKGHIAVVGAGAFGGWTAHHLLRKGYDVTLLDVFGPGNSRASSGGDSRVIRGIYGEDKIYVDLVARSFKLWKRYQKQWQQSLYFPTGALWFFQVDDTYAQKSLPIVNQAGLKSEQISKKEVEKKFPQINLTDLKSFYFEHEAGYLPARHCCQVVLENFVKKGGEYKQLAVKPGKIFNNKLTELILSDGSKLNADSYVFACGPWLSKVFPNVLKDIITPTRQEVFFFGTPYGDSSLFESNMPVWVDFGKKIWYGIPGADWRGFKVADDTRGAEFDPTSGNRKASESGLESARNYLAKRFPSMKDAPLLESRVCQYENSPDGNYIIDKHPEAENTWVIGGGSGHGFKLGPALGEFVVDRVIGNKEIDPFFALSRFNKDLDKKTQFNPQ
tara:strand:- start:123 stop:1373 length:1251 start_codon:yes stop_codon:yes gene_type:complete